MNIPELARACLKLCDEIEKAVIGENMSLAFEAAVRLDKGAAEVAKDDPDAQRVYSTISDSLGAALVAGDVERIKAALHLFRVLLAAEISDDLARSYEDATPKIGSA
jgi:hypothetical protein